MRKKEPVDEGRSRETVAIAVAVSLTSTLNKAIEEKTGYCSNCERAACDECYDNLFRKYKENLKRVSDRYEQIQILGKGNTEDIKSDSGFLYQTAWHDNKTGVETEIRMTAAVYGGDAVTDFKCWSDNGGWKGSGVICTFIHSG